MILPTQVKSPVLSFNVQPVEPDPPPRSIDPVPLVVLMFRVVVPVIPGSAPPKVRAVEVRVLVIIVPMFVIFRDESSSCVPSICKAVVAFKVVNFPVVAVVEPMVPGATQVAPIKVEASIVPVLVYPKVAPAPTTIAA